jgi:hypothetical protein
MGKRSIIRLPSADDLVAKKKGVHSIARNQDDRRVSVVVVGAGEEDYPLPTADELVQQCAVYLTEMQAATSAKAKGSKRKKEKSLPPTFMGTSVLLEKPDLARQVLLWRKKKQKPDGSPEANFAHAPLAIAAAAALDDEPVVGATVFVAAGVFREAFDEGQWTAHIAEQFDPISHAHMRGIEEFPARFKKPFEKQRQQVEKLKTLFKDSLPRVYKMLEAQAPDGTPQEHLVNAAINVINQQLMPILYVLFLFTMAINQRLHGIYKEYDAVTDVIERLFKMYRHGDAGTCGDCREVFQSDVFKEGDAFLVVFTGDGPFTIPAANGPLGVHLVSVPHDEIPVDVILAPIYGHEFMHNFIKTVRTPTIGLPEELTQVVLQRVFEAYEEKKVTFKSETVLIANQEVPTVQLVGQLFAQTLDETNADVTGGVSPFGIAFFYAACPLFVAMNAKGRKVLKMKNRLRSKSYYSISPDGELEFEVHMPDYPRMLLIAEVQRQQGFEANARLIERITRKHASPLPDDLVWMNEDQEGELAEVEISLPVQDVVAMFPYVVSAILDTPLESLGGLCFRQIVTWTAEHEKLAKELAVRIGRGDTTLPDGVSGITELIIVAAATHAFWNECERCESGKSPFEATFAINKTARAMLEQFKLHSQATILSGGSKA